MTRLNDRIAELKTVQNDWDGEGALAPDPRILDRMGEFIPKATAAAGLREREYLYPTPAGGAQAEWELEGRRALHVRVDPPGGIADLYLLFLDEKKSSHATIPFVDMDQAAAEFAAFMAKSSV